MSQSDVDKIKERLSIEEVVGSYIKLDRAGKNLKARCPFHNEKTPSFTLSPDRDNYYCFGCHASGDIFSFVQEFEGIDFREALKKLADKAGIELSDKPDKNFSEKKKLYELLELTNKYFQAHLSKNPKTIDYLKSRGLSGETIKEWRLGFAPAGWRNLKEFLVQKNSQKKYSETDLEKAGLIKKNDKGESYDRFRSRIMFPINDSNGNPVGFTGRIFEGKDDDAKYLNSPETILFDKSRILYGFDKAKSFIRKFDFSILVEGQMDLIMAHQAGYKNAVASSGTALTEEHLRMLSKISDKIVIAYDSDTAGFRASEKVWKMALSMGMDVKIAPIESGKDPADIIHESTDEWKRVIKNSKHIIEIISDQIKDSDLDDRNKGKSVSENLIPYLKSISSSIDQDHFIKFVSDELSISEDSIRKEVENFELDKEYVVSKPLEIIHKEENKKTELFNLEKEIFGLYFWQESVKSENRVVEPEGFKEKIQKVYGKDFENYFESAQAVKDQLIFEIEKIYSADDKEKVAAKIDELLQTLEKRLLVNTRTSLQSEIKKAEQNKDEGKIKELLTKIQEISAKLMGN
jgi:DNA primase